MVCQNELYQYCVYLSFIEHLLSLVLSKLESMNDLFVDEASADIVLCAVVPRSEDLFTEEEAPGSVLLLPSSPLDLLLTLGDGIHQVFTATAQRPHLHGNT